MDAATDSAATPIAVTSPSYEELLILSGLVSKSELSEAVTEQESTGKPLDAVLVEQRLIDSRMLRAVLARAWQLPAIDLARVHVDDELVEQWPEDLYRSEGWFPVHDQANGSVLVATAVRPDDCHRHYLSELVGAPIEFAVVASTDIAAAIEREARRRTRRRLPFRL